jgi:hypothetical protein
LQDSSKTIRNTVSSCKKYLQKRQKGIFDMLQLKMLPVTDYGDNIEPGRLIDAVQLQINPGSLYHAPHTLFSDEIFGVTPG